MSSMTNRRALLAALALGASPFPSARAQSAYPDRPITLIVGYPPGGSTDAAGRAAAEGLSRQLKVPVLVENIGGAGGVVGLRKAMAARPDGYTLFVGANNELSIAPLVSAAARYDVATDMTPLRYLSSQPIVLVTTRAAGVSSFSEFVSKVRANPGRFSYGSSGVGTALHLVGETIKERARLFMTHIPYRGVAPLQSDLLGGSIEYAMFVQSSILPQIEAGKVVPLAVSEGQRSPQLPQVPSLAEFPGFQGVSMGSWFMLLGPKNLPADIRGRLEEASLAMLRDPAFRKRLEDGGSRVANGTENVASLLAQEAAVNRRAVDYAKVRTD
jgi:tripartite-type tricarboxylate transporter receptor subunit TctC